MKKEVDEPGAVAGAGFNMTPMIDVTFQLIVVFLCSMKFRTLDQKIEAFLPKDVGVTCTSTPIAEQATRLDLRLRRGPGDGETSVLFLGNRFGTADREGLWERLGEMLRTLRAKDPKVSGEIHADPDVPHGEVIAALDAFRAAEVEKVTFRGTRSPAIDPFLPAR